MEYRH